KININCFDSNGNNALLIACKNRNIAIVQYLLTTNININHCNKSGNNALFIACQNNISIFHSLLNTEIDIHHCNNENNNILMETVSHGMLDLVYLLLQK